eukprot:620808-Pleurochrysis_carterae.AAC.3
MEKAVKWPRAPKMDTRLVEHLANCCMCRFFTIVARKLIFVGLTIKKALQCLLRSRPATSAHEVWLKNK